MVTFQYRAVKSGGEVVNGELGADSREDAVDRLRESGMMVLSIGAGGAAVAAVEHRGAGVSVFRSRKVDQEQVLAITRELATLLKAGIPLDRALEILIGLAATPALGTLLQTMRDDVRGGSALSQALEKRPELFTRFYVNLVRAGEAGGALGVVLGRLAEALERTKELRESVRSALVYPTILVVVAVASVALLLVWVVPRFEPAFAQSGKALPWATEAVILTARVLQQYWWALLAGFVAIVAIMRRRFANPAYRRLWDSRLLRMPLIGDVVTKLEVARFARTLSTLLANGVPLLSGLSIVRDTMANSVLAGALDGVVLKLREGRGFGHPLAETGLYPRLATQMIMVGEESGRLEEMLGRVAEVYDRDVQIAVARFLRVLEPVLILGLAVLIGGIVVAILLGVLGLSELVQ